MLNIIVNRFQPLNSSTLQPSANMDPNLSSDNFNFPEDDNLDIKRYLSLFISNWYWFAVALFFSLTITYTINRYSGR